MRRGLVLAALALALPLSASALSFPTCTISTPPGTVQPNSRVTLLWFTQDTTSASISSVGPIPSSLLPQGHIDVYPSGTTIYTMTVANSLGSRTCSVIVNVSSPSYLTSYSYPYSSASAQAVAQAIATTPVYIAPLVVGSGYSYSPYSYSSGLPWTDSYNNTYYPYGSYSNSDLYYSAANPSWDPYYNSPYYSYSPYDLPPTQPHDDTGYFIDNFFGNGNSYDPYSDPYNTYNPDPYNNYYSDPYQNYYDNGPSNGYQPYYPDTSGYGDPNSTGLGGWWDNTAPSTYDPGWSNGNYYNNDAQPYIQYDDPGNTPVMENGYDPYNSSWI